MSFFLMVLLGVIGFTLNKKLDGSTLDFHWPLFNGNKISAMLTGLIFSQLMHHSVPGIAQTIREKENAV